MDKISNPSSKSIKSISSKPDDIRLTEFKRRDESSINSDDQDKIYEVIDTFEDNEDDQKEIKETESVDDEPKSVESNEEDDEQENEEPENLKNIQTRKSSMASSSNKRGKNKVEIIATETLTYDESSNVNNDDLNEQEDTENDHISKEEDDHSFYNSNQMGDQSPETSYRNINKNFGSKHNRDRRRSIQQLQKHLQNNPSRQGDSHLRDKNTGKTVQFDKHKVYFLNFNISPLNKFIKVAFNIKVGQNQNRSSSYNNRCFC